MWLIPIYKAHKHWKYQKNKIRKRERERDWIQRTKCTHSTYHRLIWIIARYRKMFNENERKKKVFPDYFHTSFWLCMLNVIPKLKEAKNEILTRKLLIQDLMCWSTEMKFNLSAFWEFRTRYSSEQKLKFSFSLDAM